MASNYVVAKFRSDYMNQVAGTVCDMTVRNVLGSPSKYIFRYCATYLVAVWLFVLIFVLVI